MVSYSSARHLLLQGKVEKGTWLSQKYHALHGGEKVFANNVCGDQHVLCAYVASCPHRCLARRKAIAALAHGASQSHREASLTRSSPSNQLANKHVGSSLLCVAKRD